MNRYALFLALTAPASATEILDTHQFANEEHPYCSVYTSSFDGHRHITSAPSLMVSWDQHHHIHKESWNCKLDVGSTTSCSCTHLSSSEQSQYGTQCHMVSHNGMIHFLDGCTSSDSIESSFVGKVDMTKNSPTPSPTTSPTTSPTNSPTTLSPTKSPTKSPTNSPTTLSPTKSPTKSPTSSPTAGSGGILTFISDVKTWSEAQSYCGSSGNGHLAIPLNDEENEAIKDVIHAASYNSNTWIGITDNYVDSNTYFVTPSVTGSGNADLFQKWYPNEPNNVGENCVEMYPQHDGKWNDGHCTNDRPSVCQKKTYSARQGMSNYQNAVEFCATNFHNGMLAVPHNTAENDELESICADQTCWIGITDKNKEGGYRAYQRAGVQWTNWNSGEPNDSSGEDCVSLLNGGKWNDWGCEHSAYFVCEY